MVRSIFSLICGVGLIALGGLALFAWATNQVSLIQIRPTLIPMSIPVSVGFVLSGLGLITLNSSRFRTTQGFGLLILLLSALAFVADLFSLNIFQPSYFSTTHSIDYPIAPITILCFLLTGLVFLGVPYQRTKAYATVILGILGTLIFALGALALFTHLMDLNRAEEWGSYFRMAVHVPGGFGLFAVGLIAFAWRNEQHKVIGVPQWLPILVGTGIMIMTIGLWIHLDLPEQPALKTTVLLFGLIMASLLSMAVFFVQRERKFLDQISFSHQGLENEISNRKEIEIQLLHSQEELRNLSHRLQSIREEEKTNIAREVHDELGQALTVLKMDLSCLEKELCDSTDVVRATIHSMNDQIDQTVGSVQRICLELRPKVLEVFGLAEAIEWQTTEFQRRTGIQVQLGMESGYLLVDSERAVTCFRVLQEALTNVARHAEATHVRVHVEQKNGFCHLDVHDNGKGICDHDVSNTHSLGLIGIRERVFHLGGEVRINSSPENGTHIAISVPCSKPPDP